MASILTQRGKHSVGLFPPIQTTNEMQEVEVSWSVTPFCTRPALILTRGGSSLNFKGNREFWRSNQVHAEADFVLSIRADQSTLQARPNWSVMMRGRRLDIVSVENVNEADVEIRLGCKEIVSYA